MGIDEDEQSAHVDQCRLFFSLFAEFTMQEYRWTGMPVTPTSGLFRLYRRGGKRRFTSLARHFTPCSSLVSE
jgi:hypothetical protein